MLSNQQEEEQDPIGEDHVLKSKSPACIEVASPLISVHLNPIENILCFHDFQKLEAFNKVKNLCLIISGIILIKTTINFDRL